MPVAARAEAVSIAFWNAGLEQSGPGRLVAAIDRATAPEIATALATIAALEADVLVLSGVDYDAGGLALAALNARLDSPYPYLRALRPNAGLATGFDLDGDGYAGGAGDAQSYAAFPGQGGMAVLSRLPFLTEASRDFSTLLWRDLPGVRLPPLPEGAAEVLRLSSNGHHDTALGLPDGRALHLLTWHGASPAFDGGTGRNRLRNADETRFWSLLLEGALPFAAPRAPFVLIGQANADPDRGEADPGPIRALLADPRVQDVLPGPTADYGGTIGALRVAYILPMAGVSVTEASRLPRPEGARHHPLRLRLEF